MAELAINQIIKIILGILVFVVVVLSVTLAFKNYIQPYFAGVSPAEEPPNLDTEYYRELVQESNKVGVVQPDKGENFIFIGNANTGYYFSSRNPKKVYQSVDWALDPLVGLVGSDGKLRIDEKYFNSNQVLKKINMAEKIGNELYSFQS